MGRSEQYERTNYNVVHEALTVRVSTVPFYSRRTCGSFGLEHGTILHALRLILHHDGAGCKESSTRPVPKEMLRPTHRNRRSTDASRSIRVTKRRSSNDFPDKERGQYVGLHPRLHPITLPL
jgi:hypothetical protein